MFEHQKTKFIVVADLAVKLAVLTLASTTTNSFIFSFFDTIKVSTSHSKKENKIENLIYLKNEI